jgi:IrrE N-terminal-like domain
MKEAKSRCLLGGCLRFVYSDGGSYNGRPMTPEEAHQLIGSEHLLVRVAPVFRSLGYRLESNQQLRRPAVSWPTRQVASFRPGRWEDMREALAHELGHVCGDHPGAARFCGARAWTSPDPLEREAHRWAEDFLMPLHMLEPWIIGLGGQMSLSRVAELCEVRVAFARRRLRHAGLWKRVWDDVAPGALRLRS